MCDVAWIRLQAGKYTFCVDIWKRNECERIFGYQLIHKSVVYLFDRTRIDGRTADENGFFSFTSRCKATFCRNKSVCLAVFVASLVVENFETITQTRKDRKTLEKPTTQTALNNNKKLSSHWFTWVFRSSLFDFTDLYHSCKNGSSFSA